jgi:hypothetical protein
MTANLSNKQQSKLLNAAVAELEKVGDAQQAQNAANTEIAQQVVEQLKVLNSNVERLIQHLKK